MEINPAYLPAVRPTVSRLFIPFPFKFHPDFTLKDGDGHPVTGFFNPSAEYIRKADPIERYDIWNGRYDAVCFTVYEVIPVPEHNGAIFTIRWIGPRKEYGRAALLATFSRGITVHGILRVPAQSIMLGCKPGEAVISRLDRVIVEEEATVSSPIVLSW